MGTITIHRGKRKRTAHLVDSVNRHINAPVSSSLWWGLSAGVGRAVAPAGLPAVTAPLWPLLPMVLAAQASAAASPAAVMALVHGWHIHFGNFLVTVWYKSVRDPVWLPPGGTVGF